MNRFVKHHQAQIRFVYSCFDRMVLNGYIPAFQSAECSGSMVSFLRGRRQAERVDRKFLGRIANDYRHRFELAAARQGIAVVDLTPEAGVKDVRREDFVAPYFQELGNREGVAVILKAREPERITVADAHLDLTMPRRWVYVYNIYLNDPECGRLFLRICPHFPFHIRLCLNGHEWLDRQLTREGIGFRRHDNLFLDCANPQRLQELSDAFAPEHIEAVVERWVPRMLDFFTPEEQAQGYRHRLYMAQMEYCQNLLFHNHQMAPRLFDRLLDANRTIGHPDKLAVVFGRAHFHPDTRTGQTSVRLTRTRTPVISSRFQMTTLKQYLPHAQALRNESSTFCLGDLAVKKSLCHLPKLRQVLAQANDRYQDVQQDVLLTHVDRGQLKQLRQPTISATGRRTPGLHLGDPRLMAVLQAITCFVYLVGKGGFRTRNLLPDVAKALEQPDYTLAQLRYDLAKLRGKGLLQRIDRTRRYQFTHHGYKLAVLYLKLHQRFYAPLTAAICDPVPDDRLLPNSRRTTRDRLYVAIDNALDALSKHTGIAA